MVILYSWSVTNPWRTYFGLKIGIYTLSMRIAFILTNVRLGDQVHRSSLSFILPVEQNPDTCLLGHYGKIDKFKTKEARQAGEQPGG